ncbi:MAG: D-alanyl-D-alanine carboxypeptidase [Alphaproteobacteria bacterium]|nr:D-alanyl-D-alanine carboxypeptidase [Alphaproteobacteria bacterium]
MFYRYFLSLFVVLLFISNGDCKQKKYIIRKTPPKASIVMDIKTGEILYASNPDVRTQPASMTKMMTLKLLFKALKEKRVKQNTKIRISAHAAAQKPSRIGFRQGEYITVNNAILALVTKSANDVAVAVAEHLAGSEKRFVSLMNKEARRLRMYSTAFCNASGWKNTSQLTTVRDMLRLSRALIFEYPEFFPIFSTKGFYYKGQYHKNHNNLLGENGGITVDGLKTGFVNASGYNIAVTAKKGPDRVIAVVVGGKTAKKRDALVQWLLTCSFNKLAKRRYIAENKRKLSCATKLLQQKQSAKIETKTANQIKIDQSTIKNDNIINGNERNTENEKRKINTVKQWSQSSNENHGKSEQYSSGILGKSRRGMRKFL